MRRAIFAILVLATFGAFFVAQSLKNSPSVIQRLAYAGVFSPNGDGRKERLRVNLLLKEADDVTITILDDRGDPVRRLVDDVRLPRYRALRPTPAWDGRDDAGRQVPDGRYRIRLTLRRQGRNVVAPRSIRKDTTPPRPRITSSAPSRGAAPELLPGRPVTFRFGPALAKPHVTLIRTAPRVERVMRDPLPPGATSWSWDGRIAGRPAKSGTYVAVVEWRDEAENVGTSIPLVGGRFPRPRGRFPGRGGVTVRPLGVQVPAGPVRGGTALTAFVDARRARYSWSLRRVGERQVARRGRTRRPQIEVDTPAGDSGLFLLEVRTARRRTSVPVAVQSRERRRVLVVLPYETWQARNALDDDGDGAPNVLARGISAGLERVQTGLPPGYTEREVPMLRWLDASDRRYDITTDLALERATGDPLRRYRGVLLPGDSVWLTPRVRQRLRAFVRRGGRLMTLGVDSLRRVVEVSRSGRRLARPRPPARTDLFGLRIAPVVRGRTDLEVSPLPDEIALFTGTAGRFPGVTEYEEARSLGQEADALASAVTLDPPGRTVILAASFGRGLLLRPGLPDFARRLDDDGEFTRLMERAWTLLSR